jgi:hypothetical protein
MGTSGRITLLLKTGLACCMLLLLLLPMACTVLAQLSSNSSEPVKRRPIPALRRAYAAAVVQTSSCGVLSRPLHVLTPLHRLSRLLVLLLLLLPKLLRSALVMLAALPVEGQALAAARATGSPA